MDDIEAIGAVDDIDGLSFTTHQGAMPGEIKGPTMNELDESAIVPHHLGSDRIFADEAGNLMSEEDQKFTGYGFNYE